MTTILNWFPLVYFGHNGNLVGAISFVYQGGLEKASVTGICMHGPLPAFYLPFLPESEAWSLSFVLMPFSHFYDSV